MNGLPLEELKRWSASYNIELTGEMLDAFDEYADFLVDYNENVNLTAITAPRDIAIKHFLDSMLLLRAEEFPRGAQLIDVGTGAGFPGLPVKIARPDIGLTLVDSLRKRVVFLKKLSSRLGIKYNAVHMRAEDAGRKAHREKYDVAAARAVAALPVLCEYCLPLVKPGGWFAALKALGAEEELENTKPVIALLGGKAEHISNFTLPDGSVRSIIVIRKISQTPSNYPRPAAKMAKDPL